MTGLGPSTLGQVSRTVSDIGAAVAWYRDVLGLTHLYTYGELAFFDLSGTRLYLQQGKDAGPESILYFRVDDLDAVHARLVAAGVTILAAPHRVHRHPDGAEEWMAFFADPEGRPLGLMTLVPARGPA